MNKEMIPLSIPNFTGNEIKYVTEALQTGWVSTAGPFVTQFEKRLAEYVEINDAVACQSGTAGIHLALMACGVEASDAVIVPTLTFIAAVNPVRYIGAEPIFMDCDDLLCIDPEKIEKYCSEECLFDGEKLIDKKSKRHVKALVVVHVFGNMADMEAIMRIAKKYNLKVVEDATEALGTRYEKGKYTGKYAGTIGTVGIFSFNGNKIITTGGGGMVVSNDLKLLEIVRHLSTQAKVDQVRFIHDKIGYNYRMTNIQAALGVAQLEQLESFIEIKNDNYNYYKDIIQDIPGLSVLPFRDGIRSNCWFYSLFCEDEYSCSNEELIQRLSENNIQTRPIWGLISNQAPYINSYCYEIEKALFYWQHVVNIPCSTNLTHADIDRIVSCL